MIIIDELKAREITKNKIREYRKPLLEAKDAEFLLALENGANTSHIVADKNRLRDLPSQADGKNVAELKAILDGILRSTKIVPAL